MKEREGGEDVGGIREWVRGEREAYGPSKFSIPRTSRDKLQVELQKLDELESVIHNHVYRIRQFQCIP